MKEDFKHFNKLTSRYWVNKNFVDPTELVRDLTNKINDIENKDIGPGDEFKITTQARIIINGLALKIYYFLKNAILHTNDKQYISAIALLRLCLEHLVMISLFQNKLSSYIKDDDLTSLEVLLHTFCMGERIMFVTLKTNKDQKQFTSRAEHVSEALRQFDKKYGGGVQLIYDMFSDHSHVTPTSSVRMLYRQEKWDKSEPIQNFEKVRLSSISNSHEKIACGGIETLLNLFDIVKVDTIYKENEIANLLEKKGQQLLLNVSLNPNYRELISKLIKEHNDQVGEFHSKLKKYIEFRKM